MNVNQSKRIIFIIFTALVNYSFMSALTVNLFHREYDKTYQITVAPEDTPASLTQIGYTLAEKEDDYNLSFMDFNDGTIIVNGTILGGNEPFSKAHIKDGDTIAFVDEIARYPILFRNIERRIADLANSNETTTESLFKKVEEFAGLERTLKILEAEAEFLPESEKTPIKQKIAHFKELFDKQLTSFKQRVTNNPAKSDMIEEGFKSKSRLARLNREAQEIANPSTFSLPSALLFPSSDYRWLKYLVDFISQHGLISPEKVSMYQNQLTQALNIVLKAKNEYLANPNRLIDFVVHTTLTNYSLKCPLSDTPQKLLSKLKDEPHFKQHHQGFDPDKFVFFDWQSQHQDFRYFDNNKTLLQLGMDKLENTNPSITLAWKTTNIQAPKLLTIGTPDGYVYLAVDPNEKLPAIIAQAQKVGALPADFTEIYDVLPPVSPWKYHGTAFEATKKADATPVKRMLARLKDLNIPETSRAHSGYTYTSEYFEAFLLTSKLTSHPLAPDDKIVFDGLYQKFQASYKRNREVVKSDPELNKFIFEQEKAHGNLPSDEAQFDAIKQQITLALPSKSSNILTSLIYYEFINDYLNLPPAYAQFCSDIKVLALSHGINKKLYEALPTSLNEKIEQKSPNEFEHLIITNKEPTQTNQSEWSTGKKLAVGAAVTSVVGIALWWLWRTYKTKRKTPLTPLKRALLIEKLIYLKNAYPTEYQIHWDKLLEDLSEIDRDALIQEVLALNQNVEPTEQTK